MYVSKEEVAQFYDELLLITHWFPPEATSQISYFHPLKKTPPPLCGA